MPTPRTHRDPNGDKARALRHVERTAKKQRDADAALTAAMKLAADVGASVRDLEAASGLARMTVSRRLGASDPDAGDDPA